AHPLLGRLEVGIDPMIFLIEPDLPIAAFAPTGGAGLNELVHGMKAQIITRRDEGEAAVFRRSLPNDGIQKIQAFVPPMAEELSVVGCDDDRGFIQDRLKPCDLAVASLEKRGRVLSRGIECGAAIIDLLSRTAAGDAVVLDAGKSAVVAGGQMGFEVIQIKVEPNVTIEIAIAWVAWIAAM